MKGGTNTIMKIETKCNNERKITLERGNHVVWNKFWIKKGINGYKIMIKKFPLFPRDIILIYGYCKTKIQGKNCLEKKLICEINFLSQNRNDWGAVYVRSQIMSIMVLSDHYRKPDSPGKEVDIKVEGFEYTNQLDY